VRRANSVNPAYCNAFIFVGGAISLACSTAIRFPGLVPLSKLSLYSSSVIIPKLILSDTFAPQVENFLKRSVENGAIVLPYHTAVEEGSRRSNLKVGNHGIASSTHYQMHRKLQL